MKRTEEFTLEVGLAAEVKVRGLGKAAKPWGEREGERGVWEAAAENGEKTGYICVLYIYKKARMKADCGGYILLVVPSRLYVFTAARCLLHFNTRCLSSAPQSSSDRPTGLVSANVRLSLYARWFEFCTIPCRAIATKFSWPMSTYFYITPSCISTVRPEREGGKCHETRTISFENSHH